MRSIVSWGAVLVLGGIGYSVGEYYGGEMGMKLGTIAGLVFGLLVVAALNTKSL